MGDEYAEVQMNPISAEYEDAAREAADECQVDAIIFENDLSL